VGIGAVENNMLLIHHHQLDIISITQGFFVGAKSLVLQKQLTQFLHHDVLHTQPSSRTFFTDGLL
jgi:hypothetical protein